MDIPAATEMQENIRVKIVEAHNVYFNCHIYSKQDDMNSQSETEGDSNENHTERQKGETTNTSVQTEPEVNGVSYENFETQNSNSNDKGRQQINVTEHATPQALPSEDAEEISRLPKCSSVPENKIVMHPNDMEKLLQHFQRLPFNASEKDPREEELKRSNQKVQGKAQTSLGLTESPALNINAPQLLGRSRTHPEEGSRKESSAKEPHKNISTDLNKITNDSNGGSLQITITPLDVFSDLIRRYISGDQTEISDLIKIVIIHSEADVNLAKEIVSRLRGNDRFWVIGNYELEHIMSTCEDCRKAAVDWADILVPLISNTWLSEINNVSPSQRSTSLNAKYTFQLMQASYMSSGCTNLKIVAAVKEGTDRAYRDRPEIRDAIIVMRDYERLKSMIIDFYRISKTFRNSQRSTCLRQSSTKR